MQSCIVNGGSNGITLLPEPFQPIIIILAEDYPGYMVKMICTNIYVPLRTGPSHRSEMGSQMLAGERYEVIDRAGSWNKVRLMYDGYAGWIDSDHLSEYSHEEESESLILGKDTPVSLADGSIITMPAGSEIYNPDIRSGVFKVGNIEIKAMGEIEVAPLKEQMTETAKRFLGTPYLWGGRTSMGIDCSGLVQTVYKVHGISIPRDSFMQAEKGVTVNLLSDALPGDLMFFDNAQGNITHVGMYFEEGVIIHSSGKVRLDRVDHQGIFRRDEKRYTHRLRLIKRYK